MYPDKSFNHLHILPVWCLTMMILNYDSDFLHELSASNFAYSFPNDVTIYLTSRYHHLPHFIFITCSNINYYPFPEVCSQCQSMPVCNLQQHQPFSVIAFSHTSFELYIKSYMDIIYLDFTCPCVNPWHWSVFHQGNTWHQRLFKGKGSIYLCSTFSLELCKIFDAIQS